MPEIDFCKPYKVENEMLTYVIIVAKYRERWLFVKNRRRGGYELPAGKIEEGELPDDSAIRELKEETGAVDFSIYPVATYRVRQHGTEGYGMLYYANVEELQEIPDRDEIEEVGMFDTLPGKLTYPEIQAALFNRIMNHLQGHDDIKKESIS